MVIITNVLLYVYFAYAGHLNGYSIDHFYIPVLIVALCVFTIRRINKIETTYAFFEFLFPFLICTILHAAINEFINKPQLAAHGQRIKCTVSGFNRSYTGSQMSVHCSFEYLGKVYEVQKMYDKQSVIKIGDTVVVNFLKSRPKVCEIL